jgi:hypothetical protein
VRADQQGAIVATPRKRRSHEPRQGQSPNSIDAAKRASAEEMIWQVLKFLLPGESNTWRVNHFHNAAGRRLAMA